MPKTETETTIVRKATQQREGRAVARTVDTETTTRRGGGVVNKAESVLKTRSEAPETEKDKLARVARARSAKPVAKPLTKEFFRTILGTMEAERRGLPADPVAYNAKAAELYDSVREAINKASRAGQSEEWKQGLRDLVEDTKRARAALAALQLHGDARQAKQKEYWQDTLQRAFALLRNAG